MDVEQASAGIDALIGKRAKQRETANREVESWREPTRLRRQRMRRENARAWADHFRSMARVHHGIAAEAAAKADAALEQLEQLEHANERSKRCPKERSG